MSDVFKEINIEDIPGFVIGQAEDKEAATGVTVILCGEDGKVCGADIRGGGPASRENGLLNPLAANDAVHAIVLSGGSAFGLDSASGVMQYLEERHIGFETGYGNVPIVVASCLFDLAVGDASLRPDKAMGYAACNAAPNFKQGNYGCGTGATVGKARGAAYMMNSGIGAYALQCGELKVGAIVGVNAMGDVYEPYTGKKIAGLLDDNGTLNANSEEELCRTALNPFTGVTNTTIGAILTNGTFNKTEMTKIAGMAHDGYARAIRPVHTMYDGDTIYAASSCTVKADINVVGTMAAIVMAKAIDNAVLHTESAYGLKCAKDFL